MDDNEEVKFYRFFFLFGRWALLLVIRDGQSMPTCEGTIGDLNETYQVSIILQKRGKYSF